MLMLDNVSKRYKDKVIFDKASFKIESPGLYLLKGNNGEGKTTLFNIIGDFVNYKGNIKNDYKNSLGYLFQNSFLIDYLTIREHFEMFNLDYSLLNKFNLSDKLDCFPSSLSNGQRQRIAFLLAIYSDNKLVLLDEPFANLDQDNSKIVEEIIKEKKKDKVIIVISHNYRFNRKDLQGIITIKNNQLQFKEFNKKEVMMPNNDNKRKLSMNICKKRWKKNKREYLKLYFLVFIGFFLISCFYLGNNLINKLVNEDIKYSVDYHKYYLKKCNEIESGSFKISKCGNPSDEELENINYGYNYDYLLNYLYNKDNLSVTNNKNIELEKGRYPLNEYEVLTSDEYEIGESITIESNIIIRDNKSDVYNRTMELKVVGIYYDLHFYHDNKIYFDYDCLEKYFKEEKLINNNISLSEYYQKLDISNYKYLSFDKIEDNNVIFEGEKESFYTSLKDLIIKVIEVIDYLKNIIIFFIIYSIYRIYKSVLVSNQKSFSFLLANSFNKLDLILKEYLVLIIPAFIIFIFNSLFNFSLEYLKEGIVIYLFTFLLTLSMILEFYSRNKIAKLMREEIW